MNTLTKQDVEKVVEKLADKSLTFGQKIAIKRAHSKGVKTIRKDFVLNENYCQECKEGSMAGQAFSGYRCGYCRKSFSHPNTGIPSYCEPCAKNHGKCRYCKCEMKILGHPILLGDVLEKASWSPEVTYYWQSFGGKASLQEIAGRIEYEEVCKVCGKKGLTTNVRQGDVHVCELSRELEIVQVAKPSPEASLFEFLLQLGL